MVKFLCDSILIATVLTWYMISLCTAHLVTHDPNTDTRELENIISQGIECINNLTVLEMRELTDVLVTNLKLTANLTTIKTVISIVNETVYEKIDPSQVQELQHAARKLNYIKTLLENKTSQKGTLDPPTTEVLLTIRSKLKLKIKVKRDNVGQNRKSVLYGMTMREIFCRRQFPLTFMIDDENLLPPEDVTTKTDFGTNSNKTVSKNNYQPKTERFGFDKTIDKNITVSNQTKETIRVSTTSIINKTASDCSYSLNVTHKLEKNNLRIIRTYLEVIETLQKNNCDNCTEQNNQSSTKVAIILNGTNKEFLDNVDKYLWTDSVRIQSIVSMMDTKIKSRHNSEVDKKVNGSDFPYSKLFHPFWNLTTLLDDDVAKSYERNVKRKRAGISQQSDKDYSVKQMSSVTETSLLDEINSEEDPVIMNRIKQFLKRSRLTTAAPPLHFIILPYPEMKDKDDSLLVPPKDFIPYSKKLKRTD